MAWYSVKAQGQLYLYHFEIILPSTTKSTQWSLPLIYSDYNFVCIYHLRLRLKCTVHIIHLYLMTLAIVLQVNIDTMINKMTMTCIWNSDEK